MQARVARWEKAVDDAARPVMAKHPDWESDRVADKVIEQLAADVLQLIAKDPTLHKNAKRAALARAEAEVRRHEKVEALIRLAKKQIPASGQKNGTASKA
jgi:hypothetical protein